MFTNLIVAIFAQFKLRECEFFKNSLPTRRVHVRRRVHRAAITYYENVAILYELCLCE